jgi:hypothetical protein
MPTCLPATTGSTSTSHHAQGVRRKPASYRNGVADAGLQGARFCAVLGEDLFLFADEVEAHAAGNAPKDLLDASAQGLRRDGPGRGRLLRSGRQGDPDKAGSGQVG